jgi:SAM-dependent methyltransferase
MSELNSSRIRDMLYGSWVAKAIYAAARLDLADLVADGIGGCAELAERTKLNADALYRLMRALASVELFHEDSPRHFVMTPLAQCVRTGGEDSVKDLALFYGNEVYHSYGRLVDSLQSGTPAFDRVYGRSLWQHLRESPEAGAAFRKGMGASTWHEQLPLPDSYDFTGIRRLVDVGGGEGTMLAAILHEQPEMEGVLVELPGGIDPTKRHFHEAGVADRSVLIEGNGFDVLPAGDGYLLSCVLHAIDDENSIRVLSRIRDAIEPDGRLVIIERIVSPEENPGLAKFLDLTMMVMNGGKERTEQEWHELLAAASFKLTRIVPIPYFSGGTELVAIEATPIPR